MIFVFLDEPTLDVVSETDNLCGAYEGIDVERGVYAFFDEQLHKMIPHFSTPNERSFGGLIVSSGKYDLQPAEIDREEFISRLAKVTHVSPNPWFKAVEDVRIFLEKK